MKFELFAEKRVREIEERTYRLFLDSSKRPKVTPRHESAIMVNLEDEYPPWRVRTALENLERTNHLVSIKKRIEKVGAARFYFLDRYNKEASIEKIQKKIDISASWIKKYSDIRITDMIGAHLHDIVRAELRAQGFRIIGEKTKKYNKKVWPKKQTLDIIAEHKMQKLAIGVEIKNTFRLPPIAIISTKIDMCHYLGITPVFACRWLQPHRSKIEKEGGFLWQFKKQMYPRGQEEFVEILRRRFKFPIEVNSQLPDFAIQEFEKWVKDSGKEKG